MIVGVVVAVVAGGVRVMPIVYDRMNHAVIVCA
jgi:hypothetical protein